MADTHHVVPQQRIKIARSAAAAKTKIVGKSLSPAEKRLLNEPLGRILNDRRNLVTLSRERHHRAHGGFERLTRSDLHRHIDEFAADYALEAALDHELRLIDQGERRT